MRNTILVIGLWCCITAMGSASAQVAGGCNTPVEQRTSDAGCYFVASMDLGELPPASAYWHLDVYPTRAAAEAVKGPRGTVVESFEKIWLYTIAEADWRAPAGEHVATVGPLPTSPGKRYTARYMETTFMPGNTSTIHRHSGPEAWYIVSGTQCLETPDGIKVARAGEWLVVPEGPPMAVTSVGAEIRRSAFVVLHDSTQPWITMVADWLPPGRCPK